MMEKTIEQNQNISKCVTCQFYDKKNDRCKSSGKEKCSNNTDFSKCSDYLISDKLVHF